MSLVMLLVGDIGNWTRVYHGFSDGTIPYSLYFVFYCLIPIYRSSINCMGVTAGRLST